MSNRRKLRYLSSPLHRQRVAAMPRESRRTTLRIYHGYHRQLVLDGLEGKNHD
jgi:hypothetical protein